MPTPASGLRPDGPAFDTNVLRSPTTRLLATCWMESSGCLTSVLPMVFLELTAVYESSRAGDIPRLHRDAWLAALDDPDTVFHKVEMTDSQQDAAAEIRGKFDLKCFPKLNDASEIYSNPDAVVLSQGLACGMDMLVTNDLASIDHYVVNDVVQSVLGRNSPYVRTFDQAINSAHCGAEASRQLLCRALASVWPADRTALSLDESRDLLDALCGRLDGGARMPETAQRLINAFETDTELEDLIETAQLEARESLAVKSERRRRDCPGALPSPSSGSTVVVPADNVLPCISMS